MQALVHNFHSSPMNQTGLTGPLSLHLLSPGGPVGRAPAQLPASVAWLISCSIIDHLRTTTGTKYQQQEMTANNKDNRMISAQLDFNAA